MREIFGRLFAAIRSFFRRIFGPKVPRDTASAPSTPHAEAWRIILSEPIFEPFDWPALARTLDLEKRGRERGRAELPPSDHDELDEVESEILRQIETLVKNKRDRLESAAHGLSLGPTAGHIQATISNLAPFTSNAIAELRARGQVQRTKLAPIAETARLHISELNRFREGNNLTHPAHAADAPWRRWLAGWSIIAAMLVAETLINGSAIANGMYNGLIAGWTIAFGVALLNTMVAFLLGWGAKWLRHPKLRAKCGGLFFLLFWFVVSAFVNLSVAVFRGALDIDPDNAAALVMKNLWPPNLNIMNFYSMLLLGMGGLFSTIAFLDGFALFGFDDHFPLYGRKTRSRNRARDRFNEKYESAIKEISWLKDAKLTRVREDCIAIPGLIANYKEKAQRLAGWRQMLTQSFKTAEEGANHLVDIYRRANMATRSTAPPPHFHMPLSLDTSCASIDPSLFSSNAQFSVGELAGFQDQIIAAYEEIVRSLPTLDDQ